MTQARIVFVLWAARFDERLAALFVAELRRAGLRVKLVSLVGMPSTGAYGVAMVPDLSLEQALPLASHASAVIIPCGTSGLSRMLNDPRMQEFLVQTSLAGAVLIVNQAGISDLDSFRWPTLSKPPMIEYADREESMNVVQQLAELLLTVPPETSRANRP